MTTDDIPSHKPLDLEKLESKREDFVETFFRKGAEFTSQLLAEVQTLHAENERLQRENAELRHHLASEEAIRELLQKIDRLEEEKRRLNLSIRDETEKMSNYEERYHEVERELDTMANLYVALSQLHSKFSPKEMMGVIEQLLAQFVGAGSFVIYLRRIVGGERVLVPVHAYHCNDSPAALPWNEGSIGESASTQMTSLGDPANRIAGVPLACIPMVFGDDTVGVISVLDFFEQKKKFEDIDFELFKLLAVHSASAIVAAGLMANPDAMGAGLERYEHL